jgi:hypothetical protein
MAIRDMDIAAEIIGVNPLRAKLSAFAVSSFYMGISGALLFTRLPRRGRGGRSLRHPEVVPGAVHDHHRRLGSDLRQLRGAAFMVLLPVASEGRAGRQHGLGHGDRDAFPVRGRGFPDHVLPDRGAARAGAVVAL